MYKQGGLFKFLLIVAGALLLVMLLAPSALAINCQTRVQALDEEICPYLSTEVPDQTEIPLTGGDVFTCTFPTPLAALYLASLAGDFSIEVSQSELGAFVNKIGGYGDPETWTNWWVFAVNGFMSPLGASNLEAEENDAYLWMNVPSEAPWSYMALMIDGPETVPLGEEVSFTVTGDDLGKPNNQADVVRFGLDPAATEVETPAEFKPVAGATVHNGTTVQISDDEGKITVTGTRPGTYSIWAEKSFDDTFFYVASTQARTFTVPFTDMEEENPYYEAVHKIAGLGIVGGYEISPLHIDYRPENNLYRAQFAKMIALTLGLDVEEGSTTPFIDLGAQDPDNLYPHDYVAAAYEAGITKGLTTDTFGPYLEITRAQVITMAVRALQNLYPGVLEQPDPGFKSTWGDFSAVHGEKAKIAEFNSLLDGLPLATTASNPWASMSRGEAAQVMANMLELLER